MNDLFLFVDCWHYETCFAFISAALAACRLFTKRERENNVLADGRHRH